MIPPHGPILKKRAEVRLATLSFVVLLILSAGAALATSILSAWAAESLAAPVPLIGNFLRLSLTHNPHIAFSIAIPSPFEEIVIGAALVGICLMAYHARRVRLSSVGFGLIIGGAVANIIDRARDGAVTDFIAVGTFPVFNIADSCITVGAILLLLEAWKTRKTRN